MSYERINISNNAHDLTGKLFGRLVAIAPIGKKLTNIEWLCVCSCGSEMTATTVLLNRKHVRSCGCIRAETPNYKTHGQTNTTEYSAWAKMKDRCYRKNNKDFSHYGGRGISVCSRWLNSFENFFADMGEKHSKKHSIDRIDNDGDYTPDNCRWATPEQQAYNRRNTVYLTHNGITKNLREWSRTTEIPKRIIRQRLNRGWPSDKTLNTLFKLSNSRR